MSLVIDALSIRRGAKTVLDDFSMTVEPGRVTALLGPNGAGKSSLVLALAGALPVAGGSFGLDAAPLTGASPERIRAAGIAAVPEGHRVLAGLSVEDNLLAAGFTISAAEARRGADSVYGIFPELAERRKQKAGTMSGGQQQMLVLGQALIAKPKFILVDEMSLGLAPLIVKRLMGVIDRLAAAGTGILLIEQFTTLALKHAHSAHILSRGRLSFSGSPQVLIDDPDILHRAYLA